MNIEKHFNTTLKFCNNCEKSKTLSCFNKMTRAKDGLQSKCKVCFLEYRNASKDKMKEYLVLYRTENKNKILDQQREYKAKNKDTISRKNKSYAKNNREKINLYVRTKTNNCIDFKIKNNLRSYIKAKLRLRKTNSSLQHLEYKISDLMKHLETKFQDGMTWENHGIFGWHIDHIKPLCLFDFTDENQIKKAWALENLQPLWAKDNLTKNKKY